MMTVWFMVICLVFGFALTVGGICYGYRYNNAPSWQQYKRNANLSWLLIAGGFALMLLACGIAVVS